MRTVLLLRRVATAVAFALVAAVPFASARADVFPDSSERHVSPGETRGLGCDDLWYARNEIFARNGFRFETARGRAAFGSDGWTRNPRLNRFERANVDMFEGLEYRRGCR